MSTSFPSTATLPHVPVHSSYPLPASARIAYALADEFPPVQPGVALRLSGLPAFQLLESADHPASLGLARCIATDGWARPGMAQDLIRRKNVSRRPVFSCICGESDVPDMKLFEAAAAAAGLHLHLLLLYDPRLILSGPCRSHRCCAISTSRDRFRRTKNIL